MRVCVCVRAHLCMHFSVYSSTPKTHINADNFISSHVDNEQLEFW